MNFGRLKPFQVLIRLIFWVFSLAVGDPLVLLNMVHTIICDLYTQGCHLPYNAMLPIKLIRLESTYLSTN